VKRGGHSHLPLASRGSPDLPVDSSCTSKPVTVLLHSPPAGQALSQPSKSSRRYRTRTYLQELGATL